MTPAVMQQQATTAAQRVSERGVGVAMTGAMRLRVVLYRLCRRARDGRPGTTQQPLQRSLRAGCMALICLCTTAGVVTAAEPTNAPRERISLNADWRFQRGDPPGNTVRLEYDVRPEVVRSEDGKVADARPEQAQHIDADARDVLKPWILPTANSLIADPTQRHVRPPGHPGSAVAYVQPTFDDSAWQRVDLPHDWAIAGPFLADGPHGGMGRLPSWGVGWYRKALQIPASDRGRSLFLDLDGAMSYATVWLNGKLVGGWPYGYTSWRVDLTPYVVPGGHNQLAIRLDNPPDSARWYPGGGLYRNVWLTKTGPLRVAQWGTQLSTPQVSAERAQVQLAVQLDNAGAAAVQAQVSTALYALDDASGLRRGPAVAQIAAVQVQVAAGGNARVQGSTQIEAPRRWGPPPTQQPHRYVAVTEVSQGGRVVDRVETPFGVRSVVFDPDKGLVINGEHVPIRGVNNHHDLGALGAAFNMRAAERQLQLLQQMGANAIRMSHNPPAPELLELTDRMGLLVVDEVFDSWEMKKTPLDFHLIFPQWHEPDLRAMLRRDRNHPSIILWSVGNEVGEQYTGEAGAAIARRLHAIVHAEDPTRPATAAMNYASPEMPLPAALDVISLNYQGEGIRDTPEFEGTERIRKLPQYPAFHAKFPRKAILSSETASALSSRGVYLFPVSAQSSAPVRDGRGGDSVAHQVSAYELHAVDFGSSADKVFAALDRHPFVAGEFVWTGFDYLGEPTPYYSSRSSYSGILDLAGFPKDRYWLYQARWRPELPMAHLLPHWSWPGREGQVTPVHVFTSGDEAELFVNGVSQGRKRKAPLQYRLRWDAVVYQPGELRVQAYKHGRPWASDRVQTAGRATRMQLSADRNRIRGDGKDLSFITVRLLDADGRPAPTAGDRLRFRVEGAGELVATDNGDPTNLEAFGLPERNAFNGLCLAIVRAKPGAQGPITVHVQSDTLQPASVQVLAE
ncbi:beta-galactosidase GalB [Xanthomonas campestris pv. raphani]|uniref:beta-galactosidase GalB n=1 Tax=Xanthomonas campestris TaxID=339 RepID=UPI002B229FAE|nr:beta-galactosidase GalB [Xanthomonas campestris]MEA9748229.1 beta-galactosidase GalB [Xanthomonas campestris pv. raphani]MEA9848513.1 beta-galactosidase GalB [Xanthomonas campestris pv. raphani]MEA9930306.1 beta-galactosidase GalB [Xanthomonas campestris pv. raphani]